MKSTKPLLVGSLLLFGLYFSYDTLFPAAETTTEAHLDHSETKSLDENEHSIKLENLDQGQELKQTTTRVDKKTHATKEAPAQQSTKVSIRHDHVFNLRSSEEVDPDNIQLAHRDLFDLDKLSKTIPVSSENETSYYEDLSKYLNRIGPSKFNPQFTGALVSIAQKIMTVDPSDAIPELIFPYIQDYSEKELKDFLAGYKDSAKLSTDFFERIETFKRTSEEGNG